MKLVLISAAVLMLATVPAAEARTVNHHASAAHASKAHIAKVSDSDKPAGKKSSGKKHSKGKRKSKQST